MKTQEPVEPRWEWFGSRGFWEVVGTVALGLILLVGGYTVWMATREPEPQEVFLYAPDSFTPGQPVGVRVFVRDGRSHRGVRAADVELALLGNDGTRSWTATGETGKEGFLNVTARLPAELPEGDYTVHLTADSTYGKSEVRHDVQVARSFRALVTTDKPLYQPGQTIHIRTLALAAADRRPVAGRAVVLEVRDAKGNKVFKKITKTSDYGIVSGDFQLADQVNLGTYTVAAHIGDTTSERTVRVERYRLPKFRVDLTTDRSYYRPGETLTGDLSAEYAFGKPVARGRVRITAAQSGKPAEPFAAIDGQTDADGRFHFRLDLNHDFAQLEDKKAAAVLLEATLTDPADHAQQTRIERPVTTRPIRIELFPGSGRLVRGVENIVYILTVYADGRPAKTTLTIDDGRETLQTSDAGIAQITVTPTSAEVTLTVRAEDERGVGAGVIETLPVGPRHESILLRTDRAVYRTGKTAELTVLSADRAGRVFVDVVKDRQVVVMKAIEIEDGRGRLKLDLPADLFGTLAIRAHRVLADGHLISDSRVIQVNRVDDLQIEATVDKETYRPAETALLRFLVTRTDGEPAQAALSLAAVDEAVFALQETRPGLERVYFALQEELLTPRYGDHQHFPTTPEQIVRPPKESGRAEASAALLSAAAGAGPPEATRSETLQEKRERFDEEARYYYRRLTRVATLGLFALFTLCSLPLFVYAVLKLVRRRPVPDLSAEQKKELHRAGVWLTVLWPVAFVVPVLAGAMGVITCEVLDLDMMGYDTDEIIGFACGAAGALGMSLVLLWPVGRIRRVQASRRLPLLRKVVLLVPAAYLLLWAAFPALIFAQEKYILRDEWVVGVLALGAPILATAIAGVLSIAHHCATERVSLGRYVWYAVSRPFLVICAVFLLPGLLLPALGKARREASAASRIASLERNLMGEEVSERAVTAEPGEPGLKAPARVRRYFPETLLWRPQLITDDAGRAQLEVPLADSITTWRVAMGAVSKRGVLGSGQLPIRVFQDFFIDVDLPVALTRNDTVSVPVAVYNYLDRPQTVRLEVQPGDWFELLGGATQSIEIEPESVRSVYIRLKATRPGRHELQIKASGSDMADAVERHVIVDPHGKPVVQTINGRLEESRTYEVKIPAEAIDGASDLLVKIYPGAFSQVVEGLESIFRMPHGCFEQTSSVTYPNILALDYMRRTDQMTPELGMKALGYVNTGYQRLLSFEVSGGGFSLYGRSPAGLHLTALGLMQFSDMAEVRDVDGAVIERTRKWLYDQQRGDGSWRADGGGNTLTTTAYVAWALAASGEKGGDLDRALDYIVDHVDRQPSTYAIALCANALVAADHDKAAAVVDRLTKRTTTKGDFVHWDSKGAGVTHSYGRCFQVETTALAAQALLGTGRYVGTAHKALAWMISQKDAAGTWHSTQATVQAMRALLAGADGGGRVEERTPVTITANSRLAKKLVITPETSEVHRLVSLRPFVRRGTNRVALEADIGGSLAYQIVATHYVPWPRGEQPETRKPITIDLEYPTTDVKTGEVLTAKVTLTYHRSGTAAMPIVELGVPPGFEVVTDALKAVRESGAIERYSVADRTVVLYLRELRSGEPLAFDYRLRARFPVQAKAPPSVIYQYYRPEVRDVAPPVVFTVR